MALETKMSLRKETIDSLQDLIQINIDSPDETKSVSSGLRKSPHPELASLN